MEWKDFTNQVEKEVKENYKKTKKPKTGYEWDEWAYKLSVKLSKEFKFPFEFSDVASMIKLKDEDFK